MENKLIPVIQESQFAIPDRVLVVGLGATGVSLVKFLAGLGKNVTVIDAKEESGLAPQLKELENVSFKGLFGPHKGTDFLDHELIVISPGVDTNLPYLTEAGRRGARLIGEIELASAFIEEPIIAVTGTNGKTTTTTLLGRLFKKAFNNIFVGGNIGEPLINYVLAGQKASYVIAEISSFQLETIENFRPRTSILLNITEDHLDRYPSFSDYVSAKMRIFQNQEENDVALVNSALAETNGISARKLCFSTEKAMKEGAFLDGDLLRLRLDGKEEAYRRDLSPLVGIHNSENLLSVILTGHLHGIDRGVIEDAIRNFKGLPHRVEFIRQTGGVSFYNDSKATNVDATRRAVESIDSPIILIAGGKDKGGSYACIGAAAHRLKGLVLIGEAQERIERELGSVVKTCREGGLREAVERAVRMAEKGDVVLFSPMCSSFDMFENYKVRGEMFKQIVEAL
jgi:UDP-N-acetylmuramoylalanine--D-glutamate ligase